LFNWADQRKRAVGIFLCLVIAAFSTVAGWAQAGRGGISGSVTDPSGALISGAKVTLLDGATGSTQQTLTTAGGLYTFVSLNPGQYQVTATQQGFQSVVQDKIRVTVDQVTNVNIALRVGTATEVITVSETGDLVDTSNRGFRSNHRHRQYSATIPVRFTFYLLRRG
jgi:hypothetical protein